MDELLKLNNQLMQAPAGVLVALFAIAIGYAFKLSAIFPNRLIPLAVMAIDGIIFPVLQYCAYARKGDLDLWTWVPANIVIGVIIGFAAWLFHNQILKRWIDPHFFDDSNNQPPK